LLTVIYRYAHSQETYALDRHECWPDSGGKLTSSYGTHAAPPQPAGRNAPAGTHEISRPKTLTAAVTVTALAAISGLAGAIVTFGAGKSLLRSSLGGSALGSSKDLLDIAVDIAYKTLQSRAIVAVVAALILGALAFIARNGRTGVRIGLTVALVVAVGVWVLNIRDGGVPGMIRGLDGAALVFSIVAIVATWLPANQRFASDRKALRQN
jgi:hypothetical protein